MNPNLIFLPALAQIVLTLAIYVRLGMVKARALQRGDVDLERRALYEDAWPDYVRQVSNNLRNQFETPVLFFVLVLILWASRSAGALAVGLASGFFLARVAHAYVHLGSNVVAVRRKIFTVSCLLLLAMVIVAAAAILRT